MFFFGLKTHNSINLLLQLILLLHQITNINQFCNFNYFSRRRSWIIYFFGSLVDNVGLLAKLVWQLLFNFVLKMTLHMLFQCSSLRKRKLTNRTRHFLGVYNWWIPLQIQFLFFICSQSLRKHIYVALWDSIWITGLLIPLGHAFIILFLLFFRYDRWCPWFLAFAFKIMMNFQHFVFNGSLLDTANSFALYKAIEALFPFVPINVIQGNLFAITASFYVLTLHHDSTNSFQIIAL